MAPRKRTARATKPVDAQPNETLPKNKQDKDGSNPRVTEEPQDAADSGKTNNVVVGSVETNDAVNSGETNDVVIIEPTSKEPAPNEQAEDTLSLNEQLKKEQAKQKSLLQNKEKRMIKEKIERLRVENAQMEDAEAHPQPGPSAKKTPAQKRRIADVDDAEYPPYPYSRKKPIREPANYRGRNEKEFVDFIDSCEMGFIQDKAAFRTEADRVFWASQYLEKEPRDRWRLWRHEHFHELDTVTWAFFKGFLHDLLDDPYNRTVDTYEKYAAVAQRPGQTTRQYLTAVETVEQQMPHGTFDDHFKWMFFARMRPELRSAITNHNAVPETREELVNLATTLERNMERDRRDASRNTEPRDRHGSSFKARGGFGGRRGDHYRDRNDRGDDRDKDNPDQENKRGDRHRGDSNWRGGRGGGGGGGSGRGGSSSIVCYNCDKPGHISTKCPEKNPNRLQVKNKQQEGKA